MSRVNYKSSIYDVINVTEGNVGIGTNKPQQKLHVAGSFGAYTSTNAPVFQTTSSGLEIGRKLTFANRPLGLGIETEVLGSNAVFVLNENIPSSFIHIDAPSNGTNPWVAAYDADPEAPNYQDEVTRGLYVSKVDGTVYTTTEVSDQGSTLIRNPDGTTFLIPELITSNASQHAIVSSFKSSGEPNWHRVIATSNEFSSGNVYAPSICSDAMGNAYVVGDTQTIAVVFDSNLMPWWNSANTYDPNDELNGAYGGGGFLVKYDASGNPSWVSFASTTYEVGFFGNAVDETSNAIYVVGHAQMNNYTGDSLKFYNVDGSIISIPIETQPEGDTVGLVIKYNLDGNLEWVNKVDGINSDYVTQVAVDDDHNVVFASLMYNPNGAISIVMQSQDMNHLTIPGEDGYIIGKYDAQGNALWGINISRANPDYSDAVAMNIVTRGNDIYLATGVDDPDAIVITNADGTTVSLSNLYTTDFSTNAYIKFNSNGIYQWHILTNSTYLYGNDRTYSLRTGLNFDKYGNMYITPYQNNDGTNSFVVRNSDNSSNVLFAPEVAGPYPFPYYACVLKFNPDGVFMNKVATLTNQSDTAALNLVVDDVHDRLYITTLPYGFNTFEIHNREGETVYSFADVDQAAGFLVALDLDSGNVVKPGIILKLPAQESAHFHKDIFLTTANTPPYTAYLHLENRDHTYKYMPVTLEQSNVTIQKSFRWTSNSWVQESQFEPTAQGVNLVDYYYGDQSFTSPGSNHIGANISWQKRTQDNKLAFRVTTKCSLASDEEIAYRQFEALVSPVANETSNMPYGIVSAEVGDTFGPSFSDLHHTITRNSDRSVDLRVHWNTNTSNYVGNVELHVLATTRLGDISFAPLHG